MPTKAELEAELTALHQEFATYKDRVRTRAIEAADEESWCRTGLNGALTDLGLAPRLDEFDVTVTVVAYRTHLLRLKTEDEDAADEQIRQLSLSGLEEHGFVLPDGWTYESHDIDSVDNAA